jgi:hypothetical protein
LITITRCEVRTLRSILRRATLGIRHRSSIPPLVLHAEGTHLRAQYRYDSLAVEYLEPGSYRPLDSIPVPLDVLGDIEGRDDSPVVLESVEPDRTVIRWQDHGIPQTREHPVTPFGKIEPFPETPAAWTSISADVLTAMAEAAEICTADSARYALNCMQLRGTVHKVIATDGHQLLVRSGFGFPWDGDVLIKGSPIFACKAFAREQAILIGKTDTHVVLRIGPWTIWSEIQKDARFPGVEEAIPDNGAVKTRIRIDPEDALFLQAAINRLPGNEELHSPATLDLNGKVAIRARDADQSQITELVLNRSSYYGPAMRINTNRTYLSRALQLGFNEIALSDVEAPVVCRTPELVYAWQPLSGDAAIESTDNVTRIESGRATSVINPEETSPKPTRRMMNRAERQNGHAPATPANENGQTTSENPGTSLTALIQDAETLHTTLSDAKASVARQITGLRRYRKQSRLLSDTLKSLRQLKLTEHAE